MSKTTKTIQPKGKKTDPITVVLNDTINILKTDLSLVPYQQSRDVSVTYVQQQNSDEINLKETVIAHEQKLTYLFEIEKSSGNALFYVLTSENNKKSTRDQRVQLFNTVLKVFLVHVKNQRDGKPLQASTTNSFLRRFLAHVKAKYNIVMSLKDDFNFAGGITGLMCLSVVHLNFYVSRASVYSFVLTMCIA